MKIKDLCTRKDCPLKNWPTKKKDMALAFQILFDIMRSSMSKYFNYNEDEKVSRALISEWVDKMLKAMPEHYDSIEMQRRIFSNIIVTLANTYKKDGLPRDMLNEFIANEKNRTFTNVDCKVGWVEPAKPNEQKHETLADME